MGEYEPMSGVGWTAIGVAYARAEECQREDRLFDDPYASVFLEAAPGWSPPGRAHPTVPDAGSVGVALNWYVAVRTRFCDDFLLAASRTGCRQVVLLAAGLDARAFRLHWPAGTTLFEVDLPSVLGFKEKVLDELGARPRCRRIAIAVDLREALPAGLISAGFDPAKPAVWLPEGVLIYLSPDEVRRLLADVATVSAVGSQLAIEHGTMATNALIDLAKTVPALRDYTQLWKGGLNVDTAAWLAAHGWQVTAHAAATVAEAYQRPRPPASAGAFLTAVRVSTRPSQVAETPSHAAERSDPTAPGARPEGVHLPWMTARPATGQLGLAGPFRAWRR
jgi:methyltransferase (TIGR00027 family)